MSHGRPLNEIVTLRTELRGECDELAGKSSNKRVFAAIRYLDPDLPAGWNDAKGSNPERPLHRLSRFRGHFGWDRVGMFVDTQQES